MVKLEFSEKEKSDRIRNAYIAINDKYGSVADYKKMADALPFVSIEACVNSARVCVYLYFCKEFRLDPYDLIALDSYYENRKENLLENRLLSLYCVLNQDGRERFLDLLEDVVSIEKYRRV